MPRHETLRIGPLAVWPPVVLAPMAGVTNPAFRRLCRRQGAEGVAAAGRPGDGRSERDAGSTTTTLDGLYTSEMVTARGLVEGGSRTFERAAFDPDETPRSIQLYGSDPVAIGEAVRRLVAGEVGDRPVDHVDLNMGCPARKITRHGGGAALTVRPRLVAAIVRSATGAAAAEAGDGPPVPVTVKFRIGLDDQSVTYLETGRVAEGEGAAAVALHGRTAAQLYSGTADWSAVARLKEAVTSIPVLGNGDVWTPAHALALLERTGCDGVVIGRACLGRPWLFRDLALAFAGMSTSAAPRLGGVIDMLTEHLALLVARMGEPRAVRDIRKHLGWYLTGYPVGAATRRTLAGSVTAAEMAERLAALPRHLGVADGADGLPRGTQRGPQRVTLPHGWRDEHSSDAAPAEAAGALASGG